MRKAVFFLNSAVWLVGITISVAAPPNSHMEPGVLDVVIAGGRVMDPESGLDAIRNVGLRGGKIAEISVVSQFEFLRVFDSTTAIRLEMSVNVSETLARITKINIPSPRNMYSAIDMILSQSNR